MSEKVRFYILLTLFILSLALLWFAQYLSSNVLVR